uniref:Uncharacterized protein n=1 Tax=Anguilla anguilla TaxID=7936 RepID=A0A0E9XNU4_ANGAN
MSFIFLRKGYLSAPHRVFLTRFTCYASSARLFKRQARLNTRYNQKIIKNQ